MEKRNQLRRRRSRKETLEADQWRGKKENRRKEKGRKRKWKEKKRIGSKKREKKNGHPEEKGKTVLELIGRWKSSFSFTYTTRFSFQSV